MFDDRQREEEKKEEEKKEVESEEVKSGQLSVLYECEDEQDSWMDKSKEANANFGHSIGSPDTRKG